MDFYFIPLVQLWFCYVDWLMFCHLCSIMCPFCDGFICGKLNEIGFDNCGSHVDTFLDGVYFGIILIFI